MEYRKFLLSCLFVALFSTGAPAACPPDTPLLKIDGRTVDYSYFSFVESTIPQWAIRKYYPGVEGKRELLKKVLERQLILQYYRDIGFFKRPEIKEHIERFRVKTLASMYLTEHMKSPKVTEAEVEKAVKKYYRGKKVTPELRRSVKINLEARKISEERERILSSVKSHLKVINLKPDSLKDVVAIYRGRKITYGDVKPLLKGKATPFELKRALETYALYLEALREGLDRSRRFRNQLLSFEENLAVSSFERRIFKSVKVSDEEIKSYYRKHREEFKTPASAKVLIFVFPSEKEAKSSLKALESGKPLKKAVPDYIFSTSRQWTVLSNDRNNPVAMVVFSSKKRYNLLNMPDGRTLLIVVESRKPSTYLKMGDVYSTIKNRLTDERVRKAVEKRISELKRRYAARILPGSESCFGEEKSH